MEQVETAKPTTDISFYDKIDWSKIKHNRITREEFLKIKSKTKKSYSTLLGSQDELQFYIFRSLMWTEYRDIRQKGLDRFDTQEYIINSCILWPKQDVVSINSLEAGILLTLVYQVMAVSYFLSDPSKALEMILEV